MWFKNICETTVSNYDFKIICKTTISFKYILKKLKSQSSMTVFYTLKKKKKST